jgi:SAM-dependent methyltransferase
VEPSPGSYAQAANAYARARPSFPTAALDWIVGDVPLPGGSPVVELGAGTGLLTRLLIARGLQVMAVEPSEAMRAQLVRTLPQVAVVEGTAEQLSLPTDSAVAVVAANSFHWFEPTRTLPEVHRVLRPGGALVLIWSLRDPSDPLQAALEGLARRLGREAGVAYPGRHALETLEASELFTRQAGQSFPYRHRLAEGRIRDLVASWSYVNALPPRVREQAMQEAEDLVRDRGTVSLLYDTQVAIHRAR